MNTTEGPNATRRGSESNDLLGQASEARWYCLDRDGVAMLCKDEADARDQVMENDDCWPQRAPHRAVLLGDVTKNYADAERFRWLAEHTVATGLARWVHPFQFLGEAVDARRNEATTNAAPRVTTAAEAATAFVAGMPDVMSFPPLPPSPAEVGDLILQTREHVQALGWGNREQLYTESQVRALLSECASMAALREQRRTMYSRRPGLWALQAREALELIASPMRPDGTWNRDRESCRQIAAEALSRHED